MPKPVDLRRLAGEKTSEKRSIAAWGDVLHAVGHGPYKPVDFSDKLINAAVRVMGGWPSFVSRFTSEEAEKWARLEFQKTYAALASSNVNGEAIAPLPRIG